MDRSANIRIIQGYESHEIGCSPGKSLMEALLDEGIYINASCGGNGTCGKCGVIVLEGNLSITSQDHSLFHESELRKGYRLSCQAYPTTPCTIKLQTGDETGFEAITGFSKSEVTEETEITKVTKVIEVTGNQEDGYGIAIDLGTTTIAFVLVNLRNAQVIASHSTVNKQRAYGADVISRIQASSEGKGQMLRRIVQKDLLNGINEVFRLSNIEKEYLKHITIAGNTTMGHLLLGYSCESLGIYPYTPVNIGITTLDFCEVFQTEDYNIPVTLLPGISTFVGADITAGLLYCDFDQKEEICLLIDLGTNGEMAIGNKERILVCSTAAGPAFEGGNISCGVGSIPGAICSINIQPDGNHLQTIQDQSPIGICGTGVVEIASELLRNGIMDETGLLEEPYFETGYLLEGVETDSPSAFGKIIFTQKDIRELQLAKAAIRAGVELLIQRYGVTYEEIATIYLAGGFGYKIDISKAVHIGLLPKEFLGKIKTIGNSSLAGASLYLTEKGNGDRLNDIIRRSEEVSLSKDQDFYDLYIRSMNFE
ncbi:MAG: hypothetical protein K0S47_1153 [Herbinix sp.]|jgi:uncharacterized 2Fe-2S/4Fe-4S cluster protein (DUF4445 family)|nr:hypothetical protein [Herbinix sp.]